MVDLARNVDLEATWRASVEKQLDDGESSIELHTVETQFFKSEEDACSWAVYNLKKRAEEQGTYDFETKTVEWWG